MKLTRVLFWIFVASIIFLGLRYIVVNLGFVKHAISYDPSVMHPASM